MTGGLKAFYRLSERLKARFPLLPICLLLDGLFAGGPTFQIILDYNWRCLIMLKDKDLIQIHRTYELVLSQTPENRKQICLDAQREEVVQEYHWATQIDYLDSQGRHHRLNLITCKETKVSTQKMTTFKWLTNFIPTPNNVDTLANQGGRLRWKIENEGFNSQNENARKIFYFLLQIAHMLFQLIEKGSLFRKAFPKGVGPLKNIAFRLLEAWRNLRLTASIFCSLYQGHYQIRFDSS